jgi:uncharacterized protein (TIGR03435 family)
VLRPVLSPTILLFVLAVPSVCQQPTFQSAEIQAGNSKTPMHATFHDGTFEVRSATMTDLIGIAYEAHPDRLVDAPHWFGQDRFDIIARAPSDTSAETIVAMLRSLLADRFHLAFHGGEKSVNAFFLSAGKEAPKMKRSDGVGPGGCKLEPMSRNSTVDNTYVCHNVTMAAFATQLRDMASSYLTEPVVDVTGLKGSWDFAIAWTSKAAVQRMSAGSTLFESIDAQLGLKLEEERRELPTFIVERAEKPALN